MFTGGGGGEMFREGRTKKIRKRGENFLGMGKNL